MGEYAGVNMIEYEKAGYTHASTGWEGKEGRIGQAAQVHRGAIMDFMERTKGERYRIKPY